MTIETERNSQAQANPVFMTAKTAICLMAAANIPDASTIVRCLELENRDPLQNMIDPDVILGNALVVETKYRAMCSLIKDSGCHVCVDLPCGYTPKALHLSKAGMRFIGLDLPIVVQEIEPIIRSLTTSSDEISFHGIDATNYESIRTALQNVTGPLCITTEGMMMYFDAHEADTVVSNIRAMLEQHGGLWITPDPEFILQFFYSFRSIFGNDSLTKLATSKESAQQQANVTNLSNPLIINPDDISRSAKTAENFINSHGMKVEKITLAEHIPNLSIYQQLTQEQIRNFKTAMNDCHYWVITLDEQRQQADDTEQQSTPFEMNYTLENNLFKVSIVGRLDSLTAPQLLTAWEKIKTTSMPIGAEIDCAKLEYITSAGIRVFLIMQKALGRNLTLTNINSALENLFIQKGFSVPVQR